MDLKDLKAELNHMATGGTYKHNYYCDLIRYRIKHVGEHNKEKSPDAWVKTALQTLREDMTLAGYTWSRDYNRYKPTPDKAFFIIQYKAVGDDNNYPPLNIRIDSFSKVYTV